ncbi:MAG: hypothetical protein ACR2FV_06150 [Ornithinimicrobium sp.]|uniref:hypothetical protein n=1 Tax=Ornithinimicrobium sp. TaxID=1977084 RepID=UPI003D9B3F88
MVVVFAGPGGAGEGQVPGGGGGDGSEAGHPGGVGGLVEQGGVGHHDLDLHLIPVLHRGEAGQALHQDVGA